MTDSYNGMDYPQDLGIGACIRGLVDPTFCGGMLGISEHQSFGDDSRGFSDPVDEAYFADGLGFVTPEAPYCMDPGIMDIDDEECREDPAEM